MQKLRQCTHKFNMLPKGPTDVDKACLQANKRALFAPAPVDELYVVGKSMHHQHPQSEVTQPSAGMVCQSREQDSSKQSHFERQSMQAS